MYYEVLWSIYYEKLNMKKPQKHIKSRKRQKIKPEKKSAGKIIDLLNSSTDCKD